MNTSTLARTSITLPQVLLQRLRDFAHRRGETISKIVEDGVKHMIEKDQALQVRQLHQTLKEMDGAGGAGIADASTTIDELLYGDQGAWKGHRA